MSRKSIAWGVLIGAIIVLAIDAFAYVNTMVSIKYETHDDLDSGRSKELFETINCIYLIAAICSISILGSLYFIIRNRK